MEKRGAELIRKAAIFLFSLAFHAVSIYFILYAKIHIKIYPEKRVVRNVLLASPEKVLLPEDFEKFLEIVPEITSKRGSRFLEKEMGVQAGPGEAQGSVPASKTDVGQASYPGSAKVPGEASKGEFYSNFSSKFELGLASKYKTDLPPGYSFDLPARLGKIKDMSAEKKEGRIKDINRLKYPYSNFSAIGPSGGAASVGSSYGLRRGVRSARATFKVQGYDISPWAEKVVNKILVNWIIPSEQIKNLQGLVGISAVIERDGGLSSVQIVSTSMVQVLDEAAMKALRMSSPFPQFPDDFPNKSIEALFEFQYND